MSDIVDRLRAWVYTSTLYTTASEAADEIERLRCQLSSQENLTLTDAERRAVEHFAREFKGKNAATLRSLLARTSETNLDAVPAATALIDTATGEPGGWAGTGNAQNDAVPAADGEGTRHQEGSRVRASVTPTGNTQEPVAWAVVVPLGNGRFVVDDWFVGKQSADEACQWRMNNTQRGAEVIPLYRHPQPTLTDKEREAIEWYAGYGRDGLYTDTLQGLLKKMR